MKTLAVYVVVGAMAACTSLSAGTYSNAVSADSPFAYYRLNESAASQPVADAAGSNPGTYKNAPVVGVLGALVGDPSNSAVTFSTPSSQYAVLTTMGTLGSSMSSGFSVEYWLKSSDPTDYGAVMGTTNALTQTDFVVDLNYSGNTDMLRMYFRGDDGNRLETRMFTTTSGNVNIFDNSWHYIVQEYDPAAPLFADRLRFYVDGARQTASPFGTANPAAGDFTSPLTLGAVNERGSIKYFLGGSLDEVAIYKTTLSPSQISAHYLAGIPEPSAALLGCTGIILFGFRPQKRSSFPSRIA